VFQPLLPQLNLRRWTGSIYDWLTQSALDPTNSGRVTMDNLMKLVLAALEWSYEAKATDVQEKWLEQAAELLVLRHDTFQIIDGKGPGDETEQAAETEKEAASETPAQQVASPNEEQELPPSVPTEQVTQARSPKKRMHGPQRRVTARFLGLFPFPSSVSSRAVSRLWNVLVVGEHGLFRQVVECCVSKRTPNGKRTRLIPDNDGPRGKRTGVW
jgi:hypothetical protein